MLSIITYMYSTYDHYLITKLIFYSYIQVKLMMIVMHILKKIGTTKPGLTRQIFACTIRVVCNHSHMQADKGLDTKVKTDI